MATINVCVGINVAERATFDLKVTGDESRERLLEHIKTQALEKLNSGSLNFHPDGDYYQTRILDATVTGTGERLLEDVYLEEDPQEKAAAELKEAIRLYLTRRISLDEFRAKATQLGVSPEPAAG